MLKRSFRWWTFCSFPVRHSSSKASLSSLSVGIVGLPNVGKSTLFNGLTNGKAKASNFPFCTIDPNVGLCPVLDPNLSTLEQYIPAQQVQNAWIQLVDIAGIVKGASKGQGLGNRFLANIRETDAIMHVVRCMEDVDIIHVEGTVDPQRDIETIDLELLLADLATLQKMKTKLEKSPANSKDPHAEMKLSICNRCETIAQQGIALRTLIPQCSPEEKQVLCSMQLLTVKPVLYIANVSETQFLNYCQGEIDEPIQQVLAHAHSNGGQAIPLCAQFEVDLAAIEDPEEKMQFLQSFGISEASSALVTRAAYQLLGLQSFYTAGKKEIRAWTISEGQTAVNAARVIHSDIARGFIRAQVYSIDDLILLKSEQNLKAASKIRSEGKDYVLQKKDVVHFLFNV